MAAASSRVCVGRRGFPVSLVMNGPRTGGRTPWRLPTSPRGAATWRKIAPSPSTTQDSVRGTSTKRKWFGGLLALVLWCLEHTAFLTLLSQRGIKIKPTVNEMNLIFLLLDLRIAFS